MSRVLFVDDEALMRELYESLSQELGTGFEIRTVPDGVQALKLLETDPADIIVSDLEMPAMHGGEFLTAVERSYPETMRVVISGMADQLAVARCLMYGHRYFLKPVPTRELAGAIARMSRLRKVIRSDKVKRIVGRGDVLPTPPETYLRLTELIEDPESTLDEVCKIIESDPGLTARLLQVVNSAAFGYGQSICTVEQSVQIAGLEVIRALLLGLQARSFAEKRLKKKDLLETFWRHSIETATRSRSLARSEHLSTGEQATCFTVGLLHDIGKLVLAAHDEKEYSKVLAASFDESTPVHKKELESYGATHADIGAYLLGLWGLPDAAIIYPIEHHHSLDTETGSEFTPLLSLHVAQNLAPEPGRVAELNKAFLQRVGLAERVPAWEGVLRDSK